MLAGYPKTDILALMNITQQGLTGYWNENDEYAVTPSGEIPPYYENGRRRGYEFNQGVGTIGPNPFAEGAVAGSPGTLPTNWDKIDALSVTSKVQYVGTLAQGRMIVMEFTGTSSGAGTCFQMNFGPLATPASLPAMTSPNSVLTDLHILDLQDMSIGGVTSVELGVQPVDAANALLTPPTPVNIYPLYPATTPLRYARVPVRQGGLPARSARGCMFLRVNVASGTNMSGRRLLLALPNYSVRTYPGLLLGYHNASAIGNAQHPQGQVLPELVNMHRWLNQTEGTFAFRFKVQPGSPVLTGAVRGLFGLGNYINSMHVQLTAAFNPSLSIQSNLPGSVINRTLGTVNVGPDWYRLTIGYQRTSVQCAVYSCFCVEGVTLPTVNRDLVTELPPFLFGTLGCNGTSYRGTRNTINGYIGSADYYPYLLDSTKIGELTVNTNTY